MIESQLKRKCFLYLSMWVGFELNTNCRKSEFKTDFHPPPPTHTYTLTHTLFPLSIVSTHLIQIDVLYMYVQFYNYITIIVRGILVQKIQIEKSDFTAILLVQDPRPTFI